MSMKTNWGSLLIAAVGLLVLPNTSLAREHTLWGSVTVTVPTTATLKAVNKDTYQIKSKTGEAYVMITRSALKTPLATYRTQVSNGIVKSGGRVFSSSVKDNTLDISFRQKAPSSRFFNRFQTRAFKRANDYIIVMMTSRQSSWGSSARKGLDAVFNSVKIKPTDPRDNRLGTWNLVTIRKFGQEQIRVTGRVRLWKLANGTVRSRGRATVPNVGSIRSEGYTYTNGTSESYSYINGQLYEYSEGTWSVKGSRTLFSETYTSLDGIGSADGFVRQISRDRWIAFATINGVIQQTTTYTRVK
jgi:hypothetical protein